MTPSINPPRLSDFGLTEATAKLAEQTKVARDNNNLHAVFAFLAFLAAVTVVFAVWSTSSLAEAALGAFCSTVFLGVPISAIGGSVANYLYFTFCVIDSKIVRSYHAFLLAKEEYAQHCLRLQKEFWKLLSWRQLEIEIAKTYQNLGYEAELTPPANDGGVDIRLRRDGDLTLVQCKQLNKPVGVSVVREMLGLLHSSQGHSAIIVAPGGFTSGAVEYARQNNIQLLDLNAIVNLHKVAGISPNYPAPEETITKEPYDASPGYYVYTSIRTYRNGNFTSVDVRSSIPVEESVSYETATGASVSFRSEKEREQRLEDRIHMDCESDGSSDHIGMTEEVFSDGSQRVLSIFIAKDQT